MHKIANHILLPLDGICIFNRYAQTAFTRFSRWPATNSHTHSLSRAIIKFIGYLHLLWWCRRMKRKKRCLWLCSPGRPCRMYCWWPSIWWCFSIPPPMAQPLSNTQQPSTERNSFQIEFVCIVVCPFGRIWAINKYHQHQRPLEKTSACHRGELNTSNQFISRIKFYVQVSEKYFV